MENENELTILQEENETLKELLGMCVNLLEDSDMCNNNVVDLARRYTTQVYMDELDDDLHDMFHINNDYLDDWESQDTYYDDFNLRSALYVK